MFNSVKKKILTDAVPDIARLQSILSQRVYDDKNEVYIQPNSVMSIFEMPVLTGGSDAITQDLVNCFKPAIEEESTTIRIWRLTHPVLGAEVKAMANQFHNGNPLFERIGDNQYDYYLKSCREGLPAQQGKTPLTDSRLFCEISLPIEDGDREASIKKCAELRHKLIMELKTAGIPAQILPPGELLALLRFILLGENNFNWDKNYDELELISRQISALGSEYLVDDDYVVSSVDDVKRKIVTLIPEKWPSKHQLAASISMLARPDKNLALSCPHIVSITFKGIERTKAKSWATRSYLRLEKTYGTKIAKLFPKMNEQFEEWQYLRPSILDDQIVLTRNVFLVTLLPSTQQYEKSLSEANSLFSGIGFKLRQQKYIQLPLFAANLPGKLGDGYWDSLKKFELIKTATLHNTISCSPIVGNWKGTLPKGFVAPGLHGQYSTIDIFGLPADNFNCAIAASSGAGKSVLVQNLITQVLATKGQAFVIDKGGSYKRMCELFGGNYIDAQNLRLNPFYQLSRVLESSVDQETKNLSFALVRDLIGVIASPKGELSDAVRANILNATQQAYLKSGKESKIDDVVAELEALNTKLKKEKDNYDARLSDVITVLQQYCTTGIYGQYFNSYQAIDTNDFMVLEMNALENNPDLLAAVLFSVMNTISQAMYLSPRSRKKLCIIDEAWKLFSSDNREQSLFIEAGYRTARKHGGSFISITQAISDFFQNRVTKACWNSSDIKIFLRQNGSALKQFCAEYPAFFSQNEVSILNGFQTAEQAGYSSILLKAGQITSVHRLYLTPQMRALYSTMPAHSDRIEELVKQGVEIWAAVCQLAKEAGYEK